MNADVLHSLDDQTCALVVRWVRAFADAVSDDDERVRVASRRTLDNLEQLADQLAAATSHCAGSAAAPAPPSAREIAIVDELLCEPDPTIKEDVQSILDSPVFDNGLSRNPADLFVAQIQSRNPLVRVRAWLTLRQALLLSEQSRRYVGHLLINALRHVQHRHAARDALRQLLINGGTREQEALVLVLTGLIDSDDDPSIEVEVGSLVRDALTCADDQCQVASLRFVLRALVHSPCTSIKARQTLLRHIAAGLLGPAEVPPTLTMALEEVLRAAGEGAVKDRKHAEGVTRMTPVQLEQLADTFPDQEAEIYLTAALFALDDRLRRRATAMFVGMASGPDDSRRRAAIHALENADVARHLQVVPSKTAAARGNNRLIDEILNGGIDLSLRLRRLISEMEPMEAVSTLGEILKQEDNRWRGVALQSLLLGEVPARMWAEQFLARFAQIADGGRTGVTGETDHAAEPLLERFAQITDGGRTGVRD